MEHNFAAQRAETVAVYNELQEQHSLPDVADVDYFLIPTSDEADWRPLADVLTREGFECQFFEDDGEDAAFLQATLSDQAISADGIWIGEETATRIALEHGFQPDGWGLEA